MARKSNSAPRTTRPAGSRIAVPVSRSISSGGLDLIGSGFDRSLFVTGNTSSRGSIMPRHIIRFTALAFFALPVSLPHAFAVSKEMVQLQTQVQQLQDMVQHLQTSNDERMGVIVNLVQQNTDNVNRMMAAVNALQQTLKAENEQRGSSNTQLS